MKRKNKSVRGTKSMKGQKGSVGAPQKPVKYPNSRFTIERVVSMNPNVCELTIRNRIKSDVAAGVLAVGDVIPQPKKAVGRPKFTYTVTGKTPVASTKATRKAKTVRVAKVSNTEQTPAPAVTEQVNPAPIESTPVTVPVAETVEAVTPVTLPS
jgi:hypothetical protein